MIFHRKIRAKNLKVKTGVLNVTDIKAHANQVHQESQVVSITKHPHYVEKDIPENDIALLFLKEPLKITKNLNTICLPKSSINYKQICYVLSWQGNGTLILNSCIKNTTNQTIFRERFYHFSRFTSYRSRYLFQNAY